MVPSAQALTLTGLMVQNGMYSIRQRLVRRLGLLGCSVFALTSCSRDSVKDANEMQRLLLNHNFDGIQICDYESGKTNKIMASDLLKLRPDFDITNRMKLPVDRKVYFTGKVMFFEQG